MNKTEPTIKGLFVKSHIKSFEEKFGTQGLLELERAYGAPLHKFSNFEDVPIREEIKIIEACISLMHPGIDGEKKELEAGKLHFKNFSATPIGWMALSTFASDFKKMMMNSQYIARHVFNNVEFTSEDLGPKTVRVTMRNNDYPIKHFQGLFEEWMVFTKNIGTVTADAAEDTSYVYTMKWN